MKPSSAAGRVHILSDDPEDIEITSKLLNYSGVHQKDIASSAVTGGAAESVVKSADCILLFPPEQVTARTSSELRQRTGSVLVVVSPARGKKYTALRPDDVIPRDNLNSDLLMRSILCARYSAVLFPRELTFRRILSSVFYGIALIDLQGRILYANSAFTEIQEFSDCAEAEGSLISEYMDEPDRYRLKINMDLCLADGRSRTFEYVNIGSRNKRIDADMSISIFRDSGDEIGGYIAAVSDISERKAAERELMRSEARNRALLEAVPDLMFHLNDSGMCLEPAMRARLCEVYPEDVRIKTIDAIRKTFETGDVQVYEYPLEKDGAKMYYEARFVASGPSEVLVIIRNVTGRKSAEEEMIRARVEAETANRAKSSFLANMSHEIRNPLNSIMGFIEILRTTKLDEVQTEYLDIVTSSARSLLGIINDILDFSKIESGKLQIDSSPFNPVRELESVIDLYYAKANEKRIDLLTFIDPALPESVIGDALRIKQVLGNLLSNAVKFTPEEGEIRVEVILIDSSPTHCEIQFAVSDSGIGIPDYKRKRIFDAFEQADSSVTRRFGGTGLGLSISRNLVGLMGSELVLQSRMGRGSTFRFVLRMKKQSEARYGIAPEEGGRKVNCAVLVGPEPGTMDRLILRYLESFGFASKLIMGPDDAASGTEPDVIFTVFSGPGAAVLEKICSGPCGNRVAVIAHESDIAAVKGMKCGPARIILQPVNSSRLFNCVMDIVHGVSAKASKRDTAASLNRDFRVNARVLTAEDNPINQLLVRLMLEPYGITTDFASNGLEAFDRYKEGGYSLVLMDVNMPVCDGVEAAEMILAYEKESGLGHTPIVALTAKAMKGDREALLASGMDDYLPKPLESSSLREVLEKYLGYLSDGASTGSGTSAADKAAAELGIPVAAVRRLSADFFQKAGDNMDNLKAALNSGELEEAGRLAHRIKGAALNLRLEEIASIAQRIEMDSSEGKSEKAGELFVNLEEAFEEGRKAFQSEVS